MGGVVVRDLDLRWWRGVVVQNGRVVVSWSSLVAAAVYLDVMVVTYVCTAKGGWGLLWYRHAVCVGRVKGFGCVWGGCHLEQDSPPPTTQKAIKQPVSYESIG